MDALTQTWPCERCSHGADLHGYGGVCVLCDLDDRADVCTFATQYPLAARMPFAELDPQPAYSGTVTGG